MILLDEQISNKVFFIQGSEWNASNLEELKENGYFFVGCLFVCLFKIAVLLWFASSGFFFLSLELVIF